MIIIADQILLYCKIHVLLLLISFLVMLYSSFVMNTLEKIPRATTKDNTLVPWFFGNKIFYFCLQSYIGWCCKSIEGLTMESGGTGVFDVWCYYGALRAPRKTSFPSRGIWCTKVLKQVAFIGVNCNMVGRLWLTIILEKGVLF